MPALPPPPARDPLHRILHKLSRVASTSARSDLPRSPTTTSSSSSSAKSMSSTSSPSSKKSYVVDMEGPLSVLEVSALPLGQETACPTPDDHKQWTKRYCQLVGATLYIYDAGQRDDLWVDKFELSPSIGAKLLSRTSPTSFSLPRHRQSHPEITSSGHTSTPPDKLHCKAATATDANAWIDAFAAIITPSHAKKRRVHDSSPRHVPTSTAATTTPLTHSQGRSHHDSTPATPTTHSQIAAFSDVAVAAANTYIVTLPSLPPAKVLHIVLVRHGHYVNAHSKHALDSDQVLSHIGRRQADCAGRHLHHQLVTGSSARHDLVLLHSDMERAVETATIIGEYFPDCSLTPTPLLREGWPGVPSKVAPAVHGPSDDDAEGASDAAVPSPEAQAAEDRRLDMAFQATFALEDADADADRGRASMDPEEIHHGAAAAFGTTNCRVVVCHANLIRYFLCRAMGVNAAGVWGAFEINHCGITRIDVTSTGACKILAVNECGHLPQTLLTSSTDHL